MRLKTSVTVSRMPPTGSCNCLLKLEGGDKPPFFMIFRLNLWFFYIQSPILAAENNVQAIKSNPMNASASPQALPRIFVILEPYAEIARLVRAARRKAQLQKLSWEVVMIETPQMRRRLDKKQQQYLLGAMTLAEQMGGVVTKLRAPSMIEGIREILKEREEQGVPVYNLKVAEVRRTYPAFWGFHNSLLRQVRRQLGQSYPVSAIPIGMEEPQRQKLLRLFRITIKEIMASLMTVAIATGLIYLITKLESDSLVSARSNKAIIYMIACAIPALRYGFLAGIVSAAASFIAMNMLFVGKKYSLMIDDVNDAANLFLFLMGTTTIAFLGNQEYKHKLSLTKTADRFHSLLRLHRITLNNNTPEEAVKALDDELSAMLGTDIVFFLPSEKDGVTLNTLFRPDIALNEAEEKALLVTWRESKTSGVGAPYHPEGCNWRFEPLVTANDEIGVMGMRITPRTEMDTDTGRLLSGIADQAALILERLKVEQIAEQHLIQAEREKLRSMLLSSVSHDLKTPLASVIGSLSVYRSMRKNLSEEHIETLISTALEEAQRLDSFITNILDMTRLESGQIEMKEEWMNPARLVGDVTRRLRERLRRHEVVCEGDRERLEVSMDVMMTGQVLQNLLDNAVKYTPQETRIDVSWKMDEEGFRLSVRDRGAGIPEDQLEKIFDKYSRLKRQDSQVAGTGLGLAVARAIMRAQGGEIVASNHSEGGAVFTLVLPRTRQITDTTDQEAA